jgi:hypothetical protein
MRDIHRHLDGEDLERYSMGTSGPEQTACIEEHLLICEGCQDRLRETDDYLLTMRTSAAQVRRNERAAKAREWRIGSWLPALAAAACILLLVAGTFRFTRPPGPVVAVSLTALRGSSVGGSAPAARELMLHPDLTGLTESSSYRLEIVDAAGHAVRQTTLVSAQSGIKVPGLRAGLYFVRVYLPEGELLREYGLEIR